MNLEPNTQNEQLKPPVKQECLLKLSGYVSVEDSDGSANQQELTEGRWSEDDTLRFVVFIHKYQDIFNSKHQRKSCKIFKIFSKYLSKRSPAQCRSHFQKLIIKHKTIAKLKRYYRHTFGQQAYKAEMERLEQYTAKSNLEIDGPSQSEIERKEVGIQTQEFEQSNCPYNFGAGQGYTYFEMMKFQQYAGFYPLNMFQFPQQKWVPPTGCSCIMRCQSV